MDFDPTRRASHDHDRPAQRRPVAVPAWLLLLLAAALVLLSVALLRYALRSSEPGAVTLGLACVPLLFLPVSEFGPDTLIAGCRR